MSLLIILNCVECKFGLSVFVLGVGTGSVFLKGLNQCKIIDRKTVASINKDQY